MVRIAGSDVRSFEMLHQTTFSHYSKLYLVCKRHAPSTASKIRKDYVKVAAARYYERYREACKRLAISSILPQAETPLIGDLRKETGLSKYYPY